MAQHHLFLALSNPKAGREDEFHRWYDAHHLQDVVDLCPGFKRGQRYWVAAQQPGAEPPRWSSLAVYELDADDVAELHRQVSANAKGFTPANGVFDDDHVAWVYSPVEGTATIALPGGDGAQSLVLAFSDEAPEAGAAIGAGGARQLLERHPDQRGGVVPPWRYLTIAAVPSAEASSLAGDYAATTAPAAIWVFDGRGSGAVTARRAAA